MIEIIQVPGTEKRLYDLIAPLAMNPKVLRANNNYPFKTTEHFVWFIAIEDEQVIGFLPVEYRSTGAVINNYYVGDDDGKLLRKLLRKALKTIEKGTGVTAVILLPHQSIFEENGFTIETTWKLYLKMRKIKNGKYRESSKECKECI